MSAITPVRIGIVGTGAISRLHREAILTNPTEVVLAAVFDTNVAAAQQFAVDLNGVKIFADLGELISSGTIDAAIVATPHFTHFSQAMQLVESGVPVLVEKPLVTTLEDLRALRDAAASKKVMVVAGQMQRFDPTNALARRWMDADPSRFGELESFSLRSWQDITAYTAKVGLKHWLLDGQLAGGGVVVSLAVHQLDLLRFLSGADYAEVTALGSFSPPFHNGAESSAAVLLKMSNGASGTLHSTYNAPRGFQSESMTLFGDRGGFTREFGEVGSYGGALLYSTDHGRDIIDFSHVSHRGQFDLVSELSESSFSNQIVHFARAVRGLVPPINSILVNFNTIACIAAINQSILEGGHAVPVRTT